MSTSIDPRSDCLLLAIQRINDRIQTAQAQMSSGYRINKSSDDPAGAGLVVTIQSMLSKSEQAKLNLNRYSSEVNSAETALSSAVDVLDRAISIATQASSDTFKADRTSLSSQALDLLQQMLGLASTSVEGRHIFSGGADGETPYVLDLANGPTGVSAQIQFTSPPTILDATGVALPTALTADGIFDAADSSGNPLPENVFSALNQLRLALEHDDTSEVQSALESLQAASAHMNRQLAHYGALQQRLDDAKTVAEKFELNWTAALSDVRDADIPTAAIELTQSQVNLQAAYSAAAQNQRLSLFDYLN